MGTLVGVGALSYSAPSRNIRDHLCAHVVSPASPVPCTQLPGAQVLDSNGCDDGCLATARVLDPSCIGYSGLGRSGDHLEFPSTRHAGVSAGPSVVGCGCVHSSAGTANPVAVSILGVLGALLATLAIVRMRVLWG